VKGRTVAVVGFGVTGQAVGRALSADGDELVIIDDAPSRQAHQAASALGLRIRAMPSSLAGVDLVVPSPGVPVSHPVYAAADAGGVPVVSEIELASQRAKSRLVAITGTNGKTTVATLVTAILQASGVDAMAAGNIGFPLIDAVESGAEVVVAEVSSFQLQFTETFHPGVSCWLNLAADHLDWHPSHDHYAAAKSRIWANQTVGDWAVINADDDAVVDAAKAIPDGVQRVTFSARGPADYALVDGVLTGPEGVELMRADELPRRLPHDISNSLAAAALGLAAGATPAGCRDGLMATLPLPHRVGLVGEAGGVKWFDDSKATTPASVLAAVAGFPSVVLIAGGRNKGLDLTVLATTVPPVHAVVAIGEAASEVAATFRGTAPVEVAGDMESAVAAAAGMARPGDAVLLSPGCASFDWYSSYAARGDHFAAIVTNRLAEGEHRC
jgi:UDP-N-acetylmuramoylalanine--D-glutamate ligase